MIANIGIICAFAMVACAIFAAIFALQVKIPSTNYHIIDRNDDEVILPGWVSGVSAQGVGLIYFLMAMFYSLSILFTIWSVLLSPWGINVLDMICLVLFSSGCVGSYSSYLLITQKTRNFSGKTLKGWTIVASIVVVVLTLFLFFGAELILEMGIKGI